MNYQAPMTNTHPIEEKVARSSQALSSEDDDALLNASDLQSLYHNAVHCLLLCDRQIKSLQDQLKSKEEELERKDDELRGLEGRVVDMSFELANSMARADELEHRLSKLSPSNGGKGTSNDTKVEEKAKSKSLLSDYRPARNVRRNSNKRSQAVSRSWSAANDVAPECKQEIIDRSSRSDDVTGRKTRGSSDGNGATDTNASAGRHPEPRRRGGFKLPPLRTISFGPSDDEDDDGADSVSTMGCGGGASRCNLLAFEEIERELSRDDAKRNSDSRMCNLRAFEGIDNELRGRDGFRIMRDRFGLREVEREGGEDGPDIVWEAI